MSLTENDLKNIFYDGIECSKTGYVIFENVFVALQVTLGAIILYPMQFYNIPIATIGYVLFALIMLVFVLRKHLCTKCYYYGKTCHCGWGKLASKLYKKDSGNYKLGGIFAGITWGLLMLLPIIGALYLQIAKITCICNWWPAYSGFFVIVILNLFLHKKDCKECKMRYICPGSAAKRDVSKIQ